MTQVIEASEVLKRLDSIQSDMQDIKLSQARTEEQLKGVAIQISDLKTDITDVRLQLRSQDNRLWTFVGALFLAVLGFLAKFAFFPGGQS
jgi:septal ring factor EnvC (AmiA/AmiB activator)